MQDRDPRAFAQRWQPLVDASAGLGTAQIDELHRRGFPTRQYAPFGAEHCLYVLNRPAEKTDSCLPGNRRCADSAHVVQCSTGGLRWLLRDSRRPTRQLASPR